MKSVPLAAVPVFRRHKVAEGVGVFVRRHLGVTRRARGEEHYRGVVAAGGVRRALIFA